MGFSPSREQEKERVQPSGYQRPLKDPNDDPGRMAPKVREREPVPMVATVFTPLEFRFTRSGETFRWPKRLGVVVTAGSIVGSVTAPGVEITLTGIVGITYVGWITPARYRAHRGDAALARRGERRDRLRRDLRHGRERVAAWSPGSGCRCC